MLDSRCTQRNKNQSRIIKLLLINEKRPWLILIPAGCLRTLVFIVFKLLFFFLERNASRLLKLWYTMIWRRVCMCVERTCQGSTRTVQSLGRPPEISADTGWHSCPCWLCPRAVPLCDASSLGSVKSINCCFSTELISQRQVFFQVQLTAVELHDKWHVFAMRFMLNQKRNWGKVLGFFVFFKSVSQKKDVPLKHLRLFYIVL